jgi:hypothetical protein
MCRSRSNTEIYYIFENIKDSIKYSIKIFNNYLKKIHIPYNINKELDKLYEKDVKKLHNDIYEAIWNISNNSNEQKIKRIVMPKYTTHNINNYSKKYDNTNINFAELYNITLYNNIIFNYNSHKIMLKPHLEDNNIIVYEITCV